MKQLQKLFLIFCCLFGIHIGKCRKYDIESEAQKLFGEDFGSVLRRFRKTPEYLTILQSKLSEVHNSLYLILMNINTYYEAKIEDKVKHILHCENKTVPDATKRKLFRARLPHFRRQIEEPVTSSNMSGVERLDSYRKLRSALSVYERNKFKDVGFVYAGRTIHKLIEAASADDALQPSTMLPYDLDGITSTTHGDHEVTHSTVASAEASMGHDQHDHATHVHATHEPDTYRHYKGSNLQ